MAKSALVSVIIPTYNLKNTLVECLHSIVTQTYYNLEIIVVDNGSTDGTAEFIKRKFPQIKLIRNVKNLGVTGGTNRGIKYAHGDFVWLVDHDNILNRRMLATMIKLAQSDQMIGVVTPKIYYWENKKVIWSAGTGVNMITGQNFSREGPDRGQYDKVEKVPIAPANFLIKKEVIDKIGLYDDTYITSYEDADFSYRVRQSGYIIMYTPKAVCYHKFPLLDKETSKRRWLSRSYFTARNKIIFMKKNSPYFPLFATLYPAWFLIYTYQAVRYGDFSALINFYKGMYDGFKWAFVSRR